jgi:diguanylate cyclase (GGDEF)-like protein
LLMLEEIQSESRKQPDISQLVRSLKSIMSSGAETYETLAIIVREAAAAIGGHLFLSRYDAADQMFRALTWHSSVSPGDVTLDKKFMGSSYLSGQPIIVHNMSQYNYRLRPGVARLRFMSMVGVPLMTRQGLAGVLEAFAEDADHFSDLDADLLAIFAREAANVIEQVNSQREASYRAAENDFLREAAKLEQASLGSLLYTVGEAFAGVLGIDGIAVFGLDPQLKGNPLQEVMAKGFSMTDISRLKTLYGREYRKLLPAGPEGGRQELIVKQILSQDAGGVAKLLYTVPIVHRQTLHGLVVFYWWQRDKIIDMASLEKFIERMVGHITMVMGRKDIYANVQRLSFSDLLTGLANRRLFDYVLDRELKKLKRGDQPLSLLMIDLDYFKTINDVYGHQAGDAVLEQIGALLKESFRNIDLPTRYGGEEFAVILPDTDEVQANAAAERFRTRVAGHNFWTGNCYINVTVSVGGTTHGCREPGAVSAEKLILTADQALYLAKQQGRNRTVFTGGS